MTEQMEEEKCGVCLDNIKEKIVTTYPCEHSVCAQCAVLWELSNVEKRKHSCPFCRKEFGLIMARKNYKKKGQSNSTLAIRQRIMNDAYLCYQLLFFMVLTWVTVGVTFGFLIFLKFDVMENKLLKS